MGDLPATNRPRSHPDNQLEASMEGEDLATYCRRLVSTTLEKRRDEDMRVLRDEIHKSQDAICHRLSALMERNLAAAPTPPSLPVHGRPTGLGNPEIHPSARSAPFPAPAPRRSPASTNLHRHQLPDGFSQPAHVPRAPSPRLRQDHVSDPDEFLRRMQQMSFNDTLSAGQPSPPLHRTSSKVFNFHKWGIKFDNRNMTVDDFLFRLDRLRACYEASWEDIAMNFHLFLGGQVESWFWVYLKSNPNVDWRTLKFALVEQFRSLETDSELYRRMTDRLQGPSESFDDFYAKIMLLNSRLRIPKSDMEIVELLKENVNSRMGQLLLTLQYP